MIIVGPNLFLVSQAMVDFDTIDNSSLSSIMVSRRFSMIKFLVPYFDPLKLVNIVDYVL